MRDKTVAVLIVLTFALVLGLYVGMWLAYQKYQDTLATIQQNGGGLSGLLALTK